VMKPATTGGLEDEQQKNLESYQPNMVVWVYAIHIKGIET
jgi:hypothetical protein